VTSGATSEQVVGVEVDMSDRAATTVQAIGNRVRELRTDRSLTLQAMADMTGLSPSLLSLVERGKTSPSIGTLVSVAHALGVHMSDLVPGESAAREEPVIRASDQREFATNAGVTRRVLRDDRVRGVEIAINQYAPEGRSADRSSTTADSNTASSSKASCASTSTGLPTRSLLAIRSATTRIDPIGSSTDRTRLHGHCGSTSTGADGIRLPLKTFDRSCIGLANSTV